VQDTVRIITALSSRWRRVQRWTLIEWKPTLETALRIDRARSLLANPAVRIINVVVAVGYRKSASVLGAWVNGQVLRANGGII
jgi:methylphosphotriester-DNA--protein-cysteine methyltransferase